MTDALVGVWEALRHRGEPLGATVARIGADAFAAHIGALVEGFEAGEEPVAEAALAGVR